MDRYIITGTVDRDSINYIWVYTTSDRIHNIIVLIHVGYLIPSYSYYSSLQLIHV